MGDLEKKTRSGIVWVLGAALAKFAWRICAVAILARYLGPDDYGPWALVMVAVSMALAVAGSGIGPAIVVTKDLKSLDYRSLTTCAFLFGVVAALAIAFLLPIYLRWSHPEAFVEGLTFLAGCVLLLEVTALIPIAVIQKELKFDRLAKIEFTSFLLGSLSSIVLVAMLDIGVWAIAFGKVIQSSSRLALAISVLPYLARPYFHPGSMIGIASVALGFMRGGLGSAVALQGDNWIIGIVGGSHAIAIYEKAYNLVKLPVGLLGQSLQKVLFPSFVKSRSDLGALRGTYDAYFQTSLFVGLGVSVAVGLLANELVAILLGEKWASVVLPLLFLTPSLCFRISYKIPASVLKGAGKLRRWSTGTGMYAGLVLLGAFLGSPFGPEYVAIFVTLSTLVVFFYMSWFADELLGVKRFATAAILGRMAIFYLPIAGTTFLLGWWMRSSGLGPFAVVAASVATFIAALLFMLYLFSGLFQLTRQQRQVDAVRSLLLRKLKPSEA